MSLDKYRRHMFISKVYLKNKQLKEVNIMKKEGIIFIWKQNRKEYIKEIDRKEFYELMKSIKKSFSDEYKISSKLVEIIPALISITIDKDRNSQKDTPFITCECSNGSEIIMIRRCHKNIWPILDKYCE